MTQQPVPQPPPQPTPEVERNLKSFHQSKARFGFWLARHFYAQPVLLDLPPPQPD